MVSAGPVDFNDLKSRPMIHYFKDDINKNAGSSSTLLHAKISH